MNKLDKEQKMIGLFMGFIMDPEDYPYKLRIPHFLEVEPKIVPNPMVSDRDYCEWADSYQDGAAGGGYCLSFHRLEFNTNWSWLTPVIDKIGDMGYNIVISRSFTSIQTSGEETLGYFEVSKGHSNRGGNLTKIEATYQVVVEFIRFYNKKIKK